MDRFAAPWDRALTVTTWLFGLLLVGLAVGLPSLGWFAVGSEGGPIIPLTLAPLPLLGTLLLVWALAPRGYRLEGEELVVVRPLAPIRLPLAGVTAVEALPPGTLRGSQRLLGASGLFGHYGRFWSPALGPYRLYATRTSGLVALDTARGRFVLSPEPPEGFVAALRLRAPRAAAEVVRSGGPGRAGARRGWWIAAGVVGVILLLVGGIAAGVAAFAPSGVAVRGGAVVVERRWVGPVVIPLEEVRRAEPLDPALRRGWTRVHGTAGFGVAYGRFASAGLGGFQLYAWRQGPAVLLETEGGRVVLTPDDPDGFLAEVSAGLR